MNTQLKIRMLAVCAAVAVATGAARTALADAIVRLLPGVLGGGAAATVLAP